MNKQEAIKGIENEMILGDYNSEHSEGINEGLKAALTYVNEIDEPEKPEVKQFVADWYEAHKDNLEWHLCQLGLDMMNKVYDGTEMYDWFNNSGNKPFQTLINMHQLGYTIKKLYTVEIPNPNGSGYSKTYLAKDENGKVELFTWSGYTSIEFADDWKQEKNAQLTEKEIKKDYAWAWEANLAKEV